MNLKLPGYVLFNEISVSDDFITFQGIRENDQKPVLIKTTLTDHPKLDVIGYLKNDFDMTISIDSEYILKPLALEKYQNQYFLILEDEGYEPLFKVLKFRQLGFDEKLELSIQMVKAIEDYQQRRIIHKNLDPLNIFVNSGNWHVKITGFQFATKLSRQKLAVKNPAQLEGNVSYISPELTGRINRDIDNRTDFYSLGVMLYEIFTLKRPFVSTDVIELVHAHIAIVPQSPHELSPEIPKTLSEIIMKLLSKTIEERYLSLTSLEKDLSRCLYEYKDTGSVLPFIVGQNDISPSFQISQKLYGREEDIEKLTLMIKSLPHDPPQMCMIGGYSGIGKSSLVYELQRPIFEKGGFFIAGKFDQFKSNIPYSAFVQALQDLINHILTESEDRIKAWKNKIIDSLGSNAGVITDVLPELKLIIGEPPKPQVLDTEQTYNRFSILFQLFIKSFSTPLSPLVIFLDDMQWIDSASIKLIEVLMTSNQTRGLMVIGAYRSNEVDKYHPLIMCIERIKKNFGKISQIDVKPLTQDQVNDLISDTLHINPARSSDLAKTIHEKTQGNPFFINQLLSYLYTEKLIEFDLDNNHWTYDLKKIKEAKVTDNIVTLLINKLEKSSEQTQEIIKLAACTGQSFSPELICQIGNLSLEDVLKYIDEAIEEGFIFPSDSKTDKIETLQFPHDRVQQAAYSLISLEDKQKIHYKIGKLLIENLNPENLEDKIFDIVYQINNADVQITDPLERIKYAHLNLIAGQKSINSVAYKAALDYLTAGLKFLPKNFWESNYELAFPLMQHFAECSFLTGEFDLANEIFKETLIRAKTDQERLAIYILRIKLFVSLANYDSAIQNGKMALKLLNFTVPENFSKLQLLKELIWVKIKLFKYNNEKILNLPEITDQRKQNIIYIIYLIIPAAYLSKQDMYAYLMLTAVKLSLNWGNTPYTSYFYASLGIIMTVFFKDLNGTYNCCKLAISLSQRFINSQAAPSTKFMAGTFLLPYHQHIKTSIEMLKSAFENGIAVGDFVHAIYALAQQMTYQYSSGLNLTELLKEIENYREFVSKVKAHNGGFMFIGAQQTIYALKGLTYHPSMFSSENFVEEEFFENFIKNNFTLSLFFVYTYKMQITYLFDHFEETIEVGKKAKDISYAVRGHPINIERDFYYALALFQIFSLKGDKGHILKETKKIAKQLKKYAHYCPENFYHKLMLIKAEYSRIIGKKEDAIEYYDKAIESAKENGFIQHQAMGNELFGKFWLEQNKTHLAKQYLTEAHYGYYRWGADAKVKDLENKYSHLLNIQEKQVQIENAIDNGNDPKTRHLLDLTAVFKASEALSGQLELKSLLKILLQIVIENAGAERAALILEKDSKWIIQAEKYIDKSEATIEMSLERAANHLAISAIFYTLRTKETVVENDALKSKLFINDPYIIRTKIKSLMTLPLIHQKKLIGVLYLENNVTTSAFTPSRIEILQLLSSQIANSLENALLFEKQANLSHDLQISNAQLEDYSQNLEKKVYLRTHELNEKNTQLQETIAQIQEMQKKLVEQEKLVSLGALTKSIANEMRTPLNYIFNFSSLSSELAKDVINGKGDKDTVTTLSKNLERIADHAKDADEIVVRILEESRELEQKKEVYDLNKLIRDYADIVYYNYYKKDSLFSLSIETHYDSTLPKMNLVIQNIGRVIYNVIDNACYATNLKKNEKDSSYSPQLIITTQNLPETVLIKIKDNGVGIPKKILPRIFTPFVTDKPSGKGAGMGLSIAFDIISQEHGGTIEIHSEENIGTEVSITLPK